MKLARIRKALWAAGAAAGPAAFAVVDDVPLADLTAAHVAGAAGAAVSAAILAGFAVYFARNAGTVNGSDPRPPAGGRVSR